MEALRPLFAHRPQQRESNQQEGQHDHQAEPVGAQKAWVIHCTAWGNGAEAVLRYLARYVFRVAISDLIAEPEGPSFISRIVARMRRGTFLCVRALI